jgi:hypothetical protein
MHYSPPASCHTSVKQAGCCDVTPSYNETSYGVTAFREVSLICKDDGVLVPIHITTNCVAGKAILLGCHLFREGGGGLELVKTLRVKDRASGCCCTKHSRIQQQIMIIIASLFVSSVSSIWRYTAADNVAQPLSVTTDCLPF